MTATRLSKMTVAHITSRSLAIRIASMSTKTAAAAIGLSAVAGTFGAKDRPVAVKTRIGHPMDTSTKMVTLQAMARDGLRNQVARSRPTLAIAAPWTQMVATSNATPKRHSLSGETNKEGLPLLSHCSHADKITDQLVIKSRREFVMETEQAVRWRRRKDSRPGEILEAALDCFALRGFAATRLEDVAARAGVTKGTAYLYFKNKEELFKAVVSRYLVPAIEQFEAAAREPGPVSGLLTSIATMFFENVYNTRLSALPKLVISEASNFPELARFYLDEVIDRGRRLLTSLIRRGIASGEFRKVDIEHTAYCMLAPLVFSALWKHSLGPFDARPLNAAALVRCHMELLLRGLAPDKTSRPAPKIRRSAKTRERNKM
jgi:AcrR family transcriptional regulator